MDRALQILSFNIHKGFDLLKRNYRLDDLKEKIKEHHFDIVFLQEIHGIHPKNHEDSFDLDPLEFFADEIWDHYAYGKNAVYPKGHHGNAILSKYPILEWKNFDLSNHPLEQRGLLYALIEVPEAGPIHLFCTHLDLTQWGRNKQFNKLNSIVTKFDGPKIFAGDFNDWNSKLQALMKNEGWAAISRQASFPSFLPLLKLDNVFYKDIEYLESMKFGADEWRKFSDHIPIGARFLLDKKKETS